MVNGLNRFISSEGMLLKLLFSVIYSRGSPINKQIISQMYINKQGYEKIALRRTYASIFILLKNKELQKKGMRYILVVKLL